MPQDEYLPTSIQEVYFNSGMKLDVPGLLCPHGCSYMACRGLALAACERRLCVLRTGLWAVVILRGAGCGKAVMDMRFGGL